MSTVGHSRPDARATTDGDGAGRAAETAARRERLLGAAAALAAAGGYEAVHMRAVARHAQVALGTLYRHYSSKDQLLVAVLADQADTLASTLHRRPPRGDTPAERVANVLDRAMSALAREPRLAAAMVTALSSTDPEAATAVSAVESRQRSMLADAIGPDVGRSDVGRSDAARSDVGRAGTEQLAATGPGSSDDLDEVLRTLGHVWFSVMIAWVAGKLDRAGVRHDLNVAARLLLPSHHPAVSGRPAG
ncbi:MAG TPA: TetR family transcriptional regulator [Acidimicrobiia bacterium]|nr:TetR family transcriptional regulator [Acidimicrobiia bacterium]